MGDVSGERAGTDVRSTERSRSTVGGPGANAAVRPSWLRRSPTSWKARERRRPMTSPSGQVCRCRRSSATSTDSPTSNSRHSSCFHERYAHLLLAIPPPGGDFDGAHRLLRRHSTRPLRTGESVDGAGPRACVRRRPVARAASPRIVPRSRPSCEPASRPEIERADAGRCGRRRVATRLVHVTGGVRPDDEVPCPNPRTARPILAARHPCRVRRLADDERTRPQPTHPSRPTTSRTDTQP